MRTIKEFIDHKKAIEQIAIKLNIPKYKVASIIESFMLKLREEIKYNKTIEIRGFGVFKPNAKGRVLLNRRKNREKTRGVERLLYDKRRFRMKANKIKD